MKLKLFFVRLLFLMAAFAVHAEPPAAYETLATPQPTAAGAKIEVIEFFWYGCPHCYELEPYLEKWLAKKPDDVVFLRIPAILGNRWVHHAKSYYAADQLGSTDKLHSPLFKAIHEQRIPLDDTDKLGKFLESIGINKDRFFEAYQSEDVGKKIKNAYVMGQDYSLTGVPTIIINGKYRTSPSQAGSNEKVILVMDELIEKERAAKKAAQ